MLSLDPLVFFRFYVMKSLKKAVKLHVMGNVDLKLTGLCTHIEL